jgi:hypothetical protein
MEYFLQYILPAIIALVGVLITCSFTLFINLKIIKKDIEKEFNSHKFSAVDHYRKLRIEGIFNLYHEIGENLLGLIRTSSLLFPAGLDYLPQDKEERQKEYLKRYQEACKKYDMFVDVLFKNAAFLDKEVFDYLYSCLDLCRLQIIHYPDFVMKEKTGFDRELTEIKNKCWERGREINDLLQKANDYLRDQVKKLEKYE